MILTRKIRRQARYGMAIKLSANDAIASGSVLNGMTPLIEAIVHQSRFIFEATKTEVLITAIKYSPYLSRGRSEER